MFRLTLPILVYKKYIPNKLNLEKRNKLETRNKLENLQHLQNLERFTQVEYNLKLSQQLLIFIENQIIGINLKSSSTLHEINKLFLNNKLIEFTKYKNKIEIYNLSTKELLEIKNNLKSN